MGGEGKMKIVSIIMLVTVWVVTVGFDYSKHTIDTTKIRGGAGKDDIPSLSAPKFVSAEKANFLFATDKVLGVVIDGEARAYPVKVMNWHEAVNDQVKGNPILVSW